MGSIKLWQEAQAASDRCIASRSRNDLPSVSCFSLIAGMFGGAGGRGVPMMFSKIQLPRMVGEVRVA